MLTVAIASEGSLLACGTGSGDVQIWDYFGCVLLRTLSSHQGKVSGVCFSYDCRSIFSSSYDATVKQWSAEDGLLLRTFEGHEKDVNCLAIGRGD